jgi:cyclopropane fatty-acyl-phospholipid synthase-like methyltransferase/aryl carrier-like protein
MNIAPNHGYHDVVAAMIPIWSELLERERLQVTEDTDFFKAGGHSLTAMLLMTRIKRKFGKAVPLFALVEHPTVSEFARYLLEMQGGEAVVEGPAPDGSASQTERLLGYNDVERVTRRNRWFEQYYATAMSSAAHAEFCTRVYGENFGQHGMADTTQLDQMLDLLKPGPGDVILDMGCGYGLISQYVANKTGAKVIGIDLSPSAIAYATKLAEQNRNLEFRVMDIQKLEFSRASFSHIISIDTIYYAPSLRAILQSFKEIGRPDLKLGIVRTFPIRSFTAETWSPHRTELAALLTETFGSYELADLSKEENAHWRKKVDVLESLRGQFAAEANQALFDFRYSEAKYEADIEQFRYMFAARRMA